MMRNSNPVRIPGSMVLGLPSSMTRDYAARLGARSVADYAELANRITARANEPKTLGRLFGTACHYNHVDRREGKDPIRLASGCFASSLHAVPLLIDGHDGCTAIDALEFQDFPDCLSFRGAIPDTSLGRELFSMLQNGAALECSVLARPIKTQTRRESGELIAEVVFGNLEHVAVISQAGYHAADPDARCWLFTNNNQL